MTRMPRAVFRPILSALTVILSLLAPLAAGATSSDADVCDRAAADASVATGVPIEIMQAITRTETGHMRDGRFTPWPWAINRAGAGAWPPTRRAALQLVQAELTAGRRNVDIGCFQINIRWHGDAFDTIGDMFDPTQNAVYAAEFLSRLREEFGTWDAAVGAFHSRRPEAATRYLMRYRDIAADMGDPAMTSAPTHTRGPSTVAGAYPLDLRPRPGLAATGHSAHGFQSARSLLTGVSMQPIEGLR